jgi:hypothetical protein
MNQEISLKKAFSKQLVRWTLWGFAGTAALALILAAYLGVESTESSLVITAQAAAKAFRPMITRRRTAKSRSVKLSSSGLAKVWSFEMRSSDDSTSVALTRRMRSPRPPVRYLIKSAGIWVVTRSAPLFRSI